MQSNNYVRGIDWKEKCLSIIENREMYKLAHVLIFIGAFVWDRPIFFKQNSQGDGSSFTCSGYSVVKSHWSKQCFDQQTHMLFRFHNMNTKCNIIPKMTKYTNWKQLLMLYIFCHLHLQDLIFPQREHVVFTDIC